ncbi:MAG TPA: hypothetical protein VIK88_02470, partial [Candidatus Bathyarchaeia archaeon]
LLIYNVLITAFPAHVGVAFAPIVLPLAKVTDGDASSFLSVVYWYFLASFAISIPLSKLSGIQTFSLTPTSGNK